MFLEGCSMMFQSATQCFSTLSVTEAEIVAGIMVAQDMLYVYLLLESISLLVELPMFLEMDSKGTVDLANNWSIRGHTHHVDVRMHFFENLRMMAYL